MDISKLKDIDLRDIKYVLERAFADLEVQTDGTVRFRTFGALDSLVPIIHQRLQFPTQWDRRERSAATRRAIIDAKKEGFENIEGFLSMLKRQIRSLESRNYSNYVVWSKLAISGAARRSEYRFHLDDIKVSIRPKLPASLRVPIVQLQEVDIWDAHLPKGGAYAVAYGRFKTDLQAGSKLSGVLQHLSGFLTYPRIRGTTSFSAGKVRPRAATLIGENFFLFKEGKSILPDAHWYNPNFVEHHWASARYKFSDLEHDEEYLRKFQARLRKSSSREQIGQAMEMLSAAWICHDCDEQIQKTWSALEIIFSDSERSNTSYDRIIRRASFLAKNTRMVQLKLQACSRARNSFVHRGHGEPTSDSMVQWLYHFLFGLIEWIVFSKQKFESHSRFLAMLDLSSDEKQLVMKYEDIRRALIIKANKS